MPTPPEAIPPIELTIETPVDAAHAWRMLTEPDLVALWFTEASAVGEVGSPYRLDFGDTRVVGRVTAHLPGQVFEHTWAWEDVEPVQETAVRWEVTERPGGGCEIRLTHGGWAEAGSDEAARDDHEAYWSGYLDDLRDMLEEA